MTHRVDLPKGMKTKYPNVAKAFLVMALDNGGINAARSMRQWQSEVENFMSKIDTQVLITSEQYLSHLSAEKFEDVAIGAWSENSDTPECVDEILCEYFNEVC